MNIGGLRALLWRLDLPTRADLGAPARTQRLAQAQQMSTIYKETSQGGLAVNVPEC